MSEAATGQSVAWEADLLRFSAFPPPSVAFELRPLWQDLVGRPPEDIQERPKQAFRNEFGPVGDNHLFVVQTAVRLDIVYGIHPERAAGIQDLLSVGPYEPAARVLSSAARKWLEIAPAVGRIAYAPSLLHRVPSNEDGYRLAKRLLPALPIDEQSRNFLWQINRPRQSKVVVGLAINRLAKWHMLKLEQVLIQGVQTLPGMISRVGTASFALKLELDLYTDPVMPIPAESMQPLYDELAAAAEELMQRGDVQ